MNNHERIRPIRDNVLIKPDEALTKTKSGFHLNEVSADKMKGKVRFGTVLAVGPGIEVDGQAVPMEAVVNDRVIISQYGPTEFEFEKEKLVLCPQYDIEAVLNG